MEDTEREHKEIEKGAKDFLGCVSAIIGIIVVIFGIMVLTSL